MQSEDGITFIFRSPDDVAHDLAVSQEALERGAAAFRLKLTYTVPAVWDAPVGILAADLAIARQFAADPPPGPLHPADPIAAVAAAAVAAHARRRAVVPDDDMRW
jgi:hypothetical protein